jgi:hypothetical protein
MMQMLLLLAAAKGSLAGIGFCILDTRQQPEALQGTGYAVSNALTESECNTAGEDWCPLDDEVKQFEAVNPNTQATEQIEYYWWSACCTGMQVRIETITCIPILTAAITRYMIHPHAPGVTHARQATVLPITLPPYMYCLTSGQAPHCRSGIGPADV